MSESKLTRFRSRLAEEYATRFPRSAAYFERAQGSLLDGTSHAVRWNDPFMPVARRAAGAAFEDLDGNRIIDYWQGHFANLLGHNPPLIRSAIAQAIDDGIGLQSGLVHEVEADVAELIVRCTGTESARLTTSGSLGTFYGALMARAFTGRDRVLKVSGGWHGSQPFGLKGVSADGGDFDHLESEGLSASMDREIALTRFNDIDDLRRVFRESGDRFACLMLEPMLSAGGGLTATPDYMRECRALTEHHGTLLLCDELVTAFRFHAGDLTSLYGIKPDLLVLGKILGGGMPVAAVAGRRDVLELATRRSGRVKFEGGTYSAHELSLIASRAMLRHLVDQGRAIYPRLAAMGERLRAAVREVVRECGVSAVILGRPDVVEGSSQIYVHLCRPGESVPTSAEQLARRRHPWIDERLLKSTMMLEGVSGRSGIGALSLAHDDSDIERTAAALGATLQRFREAGLL